MPCVLISLLELVFVLFVILEIVFTYKNGNVPLRIGMEWYFWGES